jgi:bifunctional enzyme CysN/CysC
VAAGSTSKTCIVWFTGLSGAGKTTIARLALQALRDEGRNAFLLDGDVVRKGLSSDLGFSEADRSENLRRAAEVAALLADAGLVVLAAFITPLAVDRDRIRRRLRDYPFIEAFVSTPLSIAEQRDPKGLYRRARRGELSEFTGIDSPFEEPNAPELLLETTSVPASDLAAVVVAEVVRKIAGAGSVYEANSVRG